MHSELLNASLGRSLHLVAPLSLSFSAAPKFGISPPTFRSSVGTQSKTKKEQWKGFRFIRSLSFTEILLWKSRITNIPCILQGQSSVGIKSLNWELYTTAKPNNMRRFVRFGKYNLKNAKNIHGRVLILVVTLLHECFSCYLNCTN